MGFRSFKKKRNQKNFISSFALIKIKEENNFVSFVLAGPLFHQNDTITLYIPSKIAFCFSLFRPNVRLASALVQHCWRIVVYT